MQTLQFKLLFKTQNSSVSFFFVPYRLMDKYLISVFNLESNPNHMTPIDTFKLFRNFDAFVRLCIEK
jgi:hypothetical protein